MVTCKVKHQQAKKSKTKFAKAQPIRSPPNCTKQLVNSEVNNAVSKEQDNEVQILPRESDDDRVSFE